MDVIQEKLRLLKVIDTLSKPQTENLTGKSSSIENVLLSNIQQAVENYETQSQINLTDVRWAYCSLCTDVLNRLSQTLAEIQKLEDVRSSEDVQLSDTVLSVQQEKNVEKCLQFVVVFGVLPYLVPNVGVPISKRTDFPLIITEKEDKRTSMEQKYSRLSATVSALLGFVRQGHLSKFVFKKHLVDLLAALLQICHAPLKKPSCQEEEILLQKMLREREAFVNDFEYIIRVSHPSLLIQSLLLLQGPSTSHHKVIRDAAPPAPSWLRRACARLLTDQLIRPGGVINVIDAVIDKDTDQVNAAMWQQCERLAMVISTPPSGDTDKQRKYYSTVSPQIFQLLAMDQKEPLARHYRFIGSACLKDISTRSQDYAQEFFIQPIIAPLRDYPNGAEISDDLESSIDNLHSIFVTGSDPSSGFLSLLLPHLPEILPVYCRLFPTILHARNQSQEILARIFKFGDRRKILNSIRDFLFPVTCPGILTSDDLVELLEADDLKIDAVVHLLQVAEDPELLCEFFLSLLSDLQHFNDRNSVIDIRHGLAVLKLVSALSTNEKLQESLAESPGKAVEFIKILIDKTAEDVDRPEENLKLQKESLSLSFALIAMLIEQSLKQKKDQESVWSLMEQLQDSLEKISKNHSCAKIRDGAEDLRVAIATRGFVFQKKNQSKETSFQEAMRLLEDPLVPVQGHALLTLSKLLDKKDPETLENSEKLLKIFLECLEHEDSYIYLMAVQGLTSLADIRTEIVIGVLTKEMLSTDSAESKSRLVEELDAKLEEEKRKKMALANRSPEVRMKVGEALLKTIRLLGPMVHKFRGELLNALLYGTRDDDLFIRASSLSNLGELCGSLGYSLGSMVHELFTCVTSIAFHDPAIEVRRAAVLLVTLLLRGLGSDALKVLEPILKDLYRTLKDILATETDDVLRIHCQEALEELSQIVKKFFTPSLVMKKTIYVTRPPQ